MDDIKRSGNFSLQIEIPTDIIQNRMNAIPIYEEEFRSDLYFGDENFIITPAYRRTRNIMIHDYHQPNIPSPRQHQHNNAKKITNHIQARDRDGCAAPPNDATTGDLSSLSTHAFGPRPRRATSECRTALLRRQSEDAAGSIAMRSVLGRTRGLFC